jgi:hypothetical protein
MPLSLVKISVISLLIKIQTDCSFVRAKVLCMPLDHCKRLKIVLSFAVFHGVLSELHHLVDVAEDHVLGGGVE